MGVNKRIFNYLNDTNETLCEDYLLKHLFPGGGGIQEKEEIVFKVHFYQ